MYSYRLYASLLHRHNPDEGTVVTRDVPITLELDGIDPTTRPGSGWPGGASLGFHAGLPHYWMWGPDKGVEMRQNEVKVRKKEDHPQ